jgi:hypothetical protein
MITTNELRSYGLLQAVYCLSLFALGLAQENLIVPIQNALFNVIFRYYKYYVYVVEYFNW